MCGILGIIETNSVCAMSVLRKMTDAMTRRGPDDSGVFQKKISGSSVSLGHRRLSILDLDSRSRQPMLSDDHSLAVVFNGEIYNFIELRTELQNLGVSFETTGDTEVLLHGFKYWGTDFFSKLNGMYAIGIVDFDAKHLYLVRDRVGVKPLYVFQRSDLVLFGSELRPFYEYPQFSKEVNLKSVGNFLQYGYFPGETTIFQNCTQVSPGTYLKYDLNSLESSETSYWSIEDYEDEVSLDYELAKARLTEFLLKGFERRLVSDVPVGIFLSGGYDSSLVAALLSKYTQSKLDTFTIRFSSTQFDESNYAKQVAQILGTRHHEIECGEKEMLEIVNYLPEVYSEPFGDSSAIPTLLLSQKTRDYVKVALSADGGDELFLGYQKYFDNSMQIFDSISRLPRSLRSSLSLFKNLSQILAANYSSLETKLVRFFDLMLSSAKAEVLGISTRRFSIPEVERLVPGYAGPYDNVYCSRDRVLSSPFKQMRTNDIRNYLQKDILVKVDRATMYWGLEGRDPFLDHELIEYCVKLPVNFMIDESGGKKIIKDITHEYLPKALMDRPKQGFCVPMDAWLRGDLRGLVQSTLSKDRIQAHGILCSKEVSEVLKCFYQTKANYYKVWYLLAFQLWCDRWL